MTDRGRFQLRGAAAFAITCVALGLHASGHAAPAAPAVPPPTTGPDSAACKTAMVELRAQERAAASAPLPGGAPRVVSERLKAPRDRAARACLGSDADSAPSTAGPGSMVEPQPPASVGEAAAAAAARGASAATEAAAAASAASAAAAGASRGAPRRGGSRAAPITVPPVNPASPAPAAPRAALPPVPAPSLPRTVTSCDAAGCWASDGSRLLRQGGTLVGPRGACTQQGSVIACP